ncbi:MAG: 3-methyladenine DNA glycosylase, partial [Mycolicibacterium aromaticivorans]|nr:3-methyladenine DNA glycosylase [Mycolicibacterium aromaticivorans]
MRDGLLAEHTWLGMAAGHRARVARFTGPHLQRARRGEAHPV